MALKLLYIKKNFIKYIPKRCYNSALFISGDKAKDSYSPLTPKINYDKMFSNINQIKNELKFRNRNLDIDVIKEKWNFFRNLEIDKKTLKENRNAISKQIKNIVKDQNLNNSEELISGLQLKAQHIKEDLKAMMQSYYELEENVILDILQIPNSLDSDTPLDKETIFYQNNELQILPASDKNKNHLYIGKEQGLIEYHTPSKFYLRRNAALLERCLIKYFSNELISSNWIRFSNADFTTSVIVEGCNLEHSNPQTALILEHIGKSKANIYDTLHFTGGASLYSFCGFFAKHTIDQQHLPMRCFTSGHQYNPVKNEDNLVGLFNILQEPVIHSFIGTDQNGKEEFMKSLQLIIDIYKKLNLHFRVIFVPATSLECSESLRANIQMYSPGLSSYVNVGHLSLYNDYISRRLLMCYGKIKVDYDFINVISGSAVYIHKILACVLENENGIETFYQLVKSLSK